jgi:hypothetical protein
MSKEEQAQAAMAIDAGEVLKKDDVKAPSFYGDPSKGFRN